MTQYFFVDESGEPGFHKLSASRYFVLAMLQTPSWTPIDELAKLRKELRLQPTFEFHYIKMSPPQKQAFYQSVLPVLFRVRAAIVVKAFAGAGIVKSIIALFDNDTATVSACKALENINLPSNIVIQRLPELDLLKNYPTIGPSGFVNLDINGVAASIELYLGEDVLRTDGNKFVPIQWTGYDKVVKKYQGEVLEKVQLQSRFKEKLIRAQNGENVDWSGLQAIFQLLFRAYP